MAKPVQQAEVAKQAEGPATDDFASLLKQSFKPRTERAATEVENAVTTLVREALKDQAVIKEDVLDTIEEMIARIDQKLTAQMNESPSCAGIPADRKRLARPELSRLQLGDGLQSQDSRHERLEERTVSEPSAISRRQLGPEPALQADLRI